MDLEKVSTFIFTLVVCGCICYCTFKPDKKKEERPIRVEDMVGKYLYEDHAKVIHIDETCLFFYTSEDEALGSHGVVRVTELPYIRSRKFCSQCVSDSVYEYICNKFNSTPLFK